MPEQMEMPTEEKVAWMLEQGMIDIGNGFPAKTAQELHDILIEVFMQTGHARFPIIGTKNGNVFLLTNAPRAEHRTILDKLNDPEGKNVLFSTSLEGVQTNASERYLKLDLGNKESAYIPVGKGSDLRTIPGFTRELGFTTGDTVMQKLFGNIPGVTYHFPATDKPIQP